MNNWQTKKLGEICKFQGGSQPPKTTFVKTARDGYIRLLQIRDFESDERPVYIPTSRKLKTCARDDVLLGRYGASIGKVLWGKEGAYNVAIVKFIPDENVLIKPYLKYYLLSSFFQNQLAGVSGRAAQAGFNQGELIRFTMSFPAIPTQQQIVKRLDAIRKLQELNSKEIEKAEELFLAIARDELNPVGKGWQERKINELVNEEKGGVKIGPFGSALKIGELVDKGPVRVLYIENVVNNEFDWTKEKYITAKKFEQLMNYEVFSSDILVTIMGTIGRTCIVPNKLGKAIISSHLIKISVDINKVTPEFLNYSLNSSNYIIHQMFKQAKGAIMKGLNSRIIKSLRIPLPSISEQKRLTQCLDSAREYREDLLVQKEKLLELFESTLNKAMKGEIFN